MKICVVDGTIINHGDLSFQQFEKYGELKVFHSHTNDVKEVARRVGDAQIVIGGGPDLPPGLTDTCPNIRLICVMATGFDATDTEGAKSDDVPFCNVPSYGTCSVAQYALAHLLEICGHAAYYSEKVHEGKWFEAAKACAGERSLILRAIPCFRPRSALSRPM